MFLDVTETGIDFKHPQERVKRKRQRARKSPTTQTSSLLQRLRVAIDRFPTQKTSPRRLRSTQHVPPNFPIEDCSVLCTNATSATPFGTVPCHIHIGIMARTLALILMDKSTRPKPRDMPSGSTSSITSKTVPRGQLDFFTYMELCIWLTSFLFFRRAG